MFSVMNNTTQCSFNHHAKTLSYFYLNDLEVTDVRNRRNTSTSPGEVTGESILGVTPMFNQTNVHGKIF